MVNAANDIKERSMSKSEQRKVEKVFNSSFSKINEKIEQGQNLRSDDFYKAFENDRSAAEELLEGTIFAAQRENEEKKLKYTSNLYANINFDENISRSTANQLVKLSSNISYRQLIILSVIGRSSSKLIDLQFRNEEFKGFSRSEDFSIAVDVFELYRMSLINSSKVILDANSFNPSMLILSGVGELLYNNMELADMEITDDYEEIIEFLSNNSDDYSEPNIVGRLAVEDRINELQNNVVFLDDMDEAIEEKTSDMVPKKQFNSAMAVLESERIKASKTSKVYSNVPVSTEGTCVYMIRK